MDKEKVIAWLADEELYYRDHGDTHNSLMACNALALLKEQDKIIQNILLEKANELNDKVTTLQNEAQNRAIRRLLEQK